MKTQILNTRLILILALAVVLPLLWYLLLYAPQRQTETALRAELQLAEQAHEEVDAKLRLASELASQKSKVEQRWRKLTDCLFPADSAELLLGYLSQLATEHDLALLEKQLGFDPLLDKVATNSQLGQIEAVT
ncbi:MAG: hypothetical protein ABIJ61_06455, partial [bacterium]